MHRNFYEELFKFQIVRIPLRHYREPISTCFVHPSVSDNVQRTLSCATTLCVSLHPIQDSITYCVEPMMLGCGDAGSCQSVVARIPIIDKHVSRVSLQNLMCLDCLFIPFRGFFVLMQ